MTFVGQILSLLQLVIIKEFLLY